MQHIERTDPIEETASHGTSIQAVDTGPTLLDGIDPELGARIASRRDLFVKASATLGVLATTPLLLAEVSSESKALLGVLLPRQVIDVLNFALTLEYLESEFYSAALAAPGLIPDEYRTVFRTISHHEGQHVFALNVVLGIAATSKPHQFDFTAGGRYPDVFSNFATFAKLSQTFEDLGVAAYKGQATNLMGSPLILTTALRIHSIEARHAAEVRRVRGVKPWNGAFDAPLSKASVLAAASPFIVGGLSGA